MGTLRFICSQYVSTRMQSSWARPKANTGINTFDLLLRLRCFSSFTFPPLDTQSYIFFKKLLSRARFESRIVVAYLLRLEKSAHSIPSKRSLRDEKVRHDCINSGGTKVSIWCCVVVSSVNHRFSIRTNKKHCSTQNLFNLEGGIRIFQTPGPERKRAETARRAHRCHWESNYMASIEGLEHHARGYLYRLVDLNRNDWADVRHTKNKHYEKDSHQPLFMQAVIISEVKKLVSPFLSTIIFL